MQFAELARQKLNAADRVATGALSDSIIPTQVSIFGSIYQVGINVADYYKFVDQGVKGWADEYGGSSPYQFKNYTGSSGKKTSLMIEAIKKWLIKEGLKGANKVNNHPMASRRDRARAKISDPSLGAAIAISKAVKKRGLKPSHFWTDTQEEIRSSLQQKLAEAFKIDIITNLTNAS